VPLGLQPGQICEVAMFHAERNRCGSNFGVTLKNFSKPKSSCKSVCGDGIVAADEYCDDGVNQGGYGKCGPGCQYGERCGDGIVQPAYEQCDEGANNGHGTCLQNCQIDRIP